MQAGFTHPVEALNSPDTAGLLGHSLESPEVQRLVSGWEQLEWIDEEDLLNARTDGRLSLINRDLGLYLFFTTAERYALRYGIPRSSGWLVLTRAVFLVDFGHGFNSNPGPLPLGLKPTEPFESIVQRVGRPVRDWYSGGRICKGRWLIDDMDVDISFGRGGIKLVSVTPKRQAPHTKPPAWSPPSPSEFVELFGSPLSSLRRMPELAALNLGQHSDEIGTYGEADFSAEHGLELYFKHGAEIDRNLYPGPESSEPCLSGLRYRVDLDFSSSGYRGPLPMDLDFDDPMPVVMEKVGAPPDKEALDENDGYQRWHLARTDLHVLYSLLEDRIYRVTLLAHGCYD
jgi:hypothetical protein